VKKCELAYSKYHKTTGLSIEKCKVFVKNTNCEVMEEFYMTVKVLCPVCCRGRLLDTDEGAKIEKLPAEKVKPEWNAQFYSKCPTCGKVIAVKRVG
jgi:hypothetical protein